MSLTSFKHVKTVYYMLVLWHFEHTVADLIRGALITHTHLGSTDFPREL